MWLLVGILESIEDLCLFLGAGYLPHQKSLIRTLLAYTQLRVTSWTLLAALPRGSAQDSRIDPFRELLSAQDQTMLENFPDLPSQKTHFRFHFHFHFPNPNTPSRRPEVKQKKRSTHGC